MSTHHPEGMWDVVKMIAGFVWYKGKWMIISACALGSFYLAAKYGGRLF
jgi:hypothetical protein